MGANRHKAGADYVTTSPLPGPGPNRAAQQESKSLSVFDRTGLVRYRPPAMYSGPGIDAQFEEWKKKDPVEASGGATSAPGASSNIFGASASASRRVPWQPRRLKDNWGSCSASQGGQQMIARNSDRFDWVYLTSSAFKAATSSFDKISSFCFESPSAVTTTL